MVSENKPIIGAAAVGGRTARACDNCIKRRAGWYCAADDAFLCQSCDSSVHSANLLAHRHHRLPLKTTTSYRSSEDVRKISVPSWPQGFTTKPRTPRKKKKRKNRGNFKSNSRGDSLRLVPEIDQSGQENEEEQQQQLVHRVPVFDPSNDVERFLGRGLEDEEQIGMEGLGIFNFDDCNEKYRSRTEEEGSGSRKTFLRLDYETVMSAWDDNRSPWMAGRRPELNTAGGYCFVVGEMSSSGADAGREARVWRYREKRRRRLLGKKIRYEVRKMNAEKRPRIKGRFVKTTYGLIN